MRITNNEKLKMVLEHIVDGKSLSHICERYNYRDISKLKYWINLYKQHGEKVFINRETGIYKRDTKLLAINRVQKYNFLMNKLPFLTPENYVFLVDKSVLNCEIKIDDRIDNLSGAEAKILYSAYHNIDLSSESLKQQNIERADNWLDVKKLVLK